MPLSWIELGGRQAAPGRAAATRSRSAAGQLSNSANAKKLSDINTIRKKKNSSTPKRGAVRGVEEERDYEEEQEKHHRE